MFWCLILSVIPKTIVSVPSSKQGKVGHGAQGWCLHGVILVIQEFVLKSFCVYFVFTVKMFQMIRIYVWVI